MKTLAETPLSILDLAPYPQGKTVADAFRATKELAQHAERLGYERFWIAEHHNIVGVASAATSILIAHVAEHTSTIRVGSGGIMLPNHAPLVIAEQFGTLAALYPNRIDLGLGRAPGGDRLTMHALRRDSTKLGADFADLLEELLFFLAPADEDQKIQAIPGAGTDIPIWILGSSLYGAQLAAQTGRPYAFASHFAPAALMSAISVYRAEFKPSTALSEPRVMVGVPVIAAESDEKAEYLATSLYQTFLSMIRGKRTQALPPVKSMDGLWSPQEEAAVKSMLEVAVIGGPEKVERGLQALIDQTQADELILSSNFYEYEDRLRSFEIVADVVKRRARNAPFATSDTNSDASSSSPTSV